MCGTTNLNYLENFFCCYIDHSLISFVHHLCRIKCYTYRCICEWRSPLTTSIDDPNSNAANSQHSRRHGSDSNLMPIISFVSIFLVCLSPHHKLQICNNVIREIKWFDSITHSKGTNDSTGIKSCQVACTLSQRHSLQFRASVRLIYIIHTFMIQYHMILLELHTDNEIKSKPKRKPTDRKRPTDTP